MFSPGSEPGYVWHHVVDAHHEGAGERDDGIGEAVEIVQVDEIEIARTPVCTAGVRACPVGVRSRRQPCQSMSRITFDVRKVANHGDWAVWPGRRCGRSVDDLDQDRLTLARGADRPVEFFLAGKRPIPVKAHPKFVHLPASARRTGRFRMLGRRRGELAPAANCRPSVGWLWDDDAGVQDVVARAEIPVRGSSISSSVPGNAFFLVPAGEIHEQRLEATGDGYGIDVGALAVYEGGLT